MTLNALKKLTICPIQTINDTVSSKFRDKALIAQTNRSAFYGIPQLAYDLVPHDLEQLPDDICVATETDIDLLIIYASAIRGRHDVILNVLIKAGGAVI